MIQVGSEQFENIFRGVIWRGNMFRYTLKKFDDKGDAELYALDVVLRCRAIFASELHSSDISDGDMTSPRLTPPLAPPYHFVAQANTLSKSAEYLERGRES